MKLMQDAILLLLQILLVFGKNTVWHVFEHVLLHSFLSGKHLGKASLSEL